MRFRLAPRSMTLNGYKLEFSTKFALSNRTRTGQLATDIKLCSDKVKFVRVVEFV